MQRNTRDPQQLQQNSQRNYRDEEDSENPVLYLKHLLLKHKIKWLAEKARQEARLRKIEHLTSILYNGEEFPDVSCFKTAIHCMTSF